MTKTNIGQDAQAGQMGGDSVGFGGVATGTTSSSLTLSGGTWTTDAYVGHLVAAAGVYGVITTNSATVLTVDRWYSPATPGGVAGSTPGNVSFTILPGNAPCWYMALTANGGAPSVSDTTLTGEITSAGGGLIRKLATYAHTTSAASYSLAATFTVNGSDSVPVTIHKIGIFNSITSGRMQFETVLSADATLSAIADSLTITDTVSM